MHQACRLFQFTKIPPRQSDVRKQMLRKLEHLDQGRGAIAMMTKDQWGEFLNSLPPAEFLELLAWYDENKQAEAGNVEAS